jgi:hypothetical protein
MRRGPRFWWTFALCAISLTNLAVDESPISALLTFGIGFGLIVLCYPLWRALAVRSSVLATAGHTELLEETQVDRPLHPSEPSSNVRRLEG